MKLIDRDKFISDMFDFYIDEWEKENADNN